MAQNQVIKVNGLFTFPNDLSEVPEGALFKANNAVIDRDSIAEPRRGFTTLDYKLPGSSYRAERLFSYKEKLFARYNTNNLAYYETTTTSITASIALSSANLTVTTTSGLSEGMTVVGTGIPDDSFITNLSSSGTTITISNNATETNSSVSLIAAGWKKYDSWSFGDPTSEYKSRSAGANQNMYITTDEGVKKLDAVSSNWVDAGVPRALELELELASATSGFLSSGGVCAYRVVWGYIDLNDNLLLGSPSQRSLITNNTSSAKDVNIQVVIPEGITTDYFYQIYRSAPVNSSTNREPTDELTLVYEDNPTASEISNGITGEFTDQVPESLRVLGATIYTAPSLEGILQGNTVPPFAIDIATFKNSTFYANTKTKHNLRVNIVGVGGTTGVQFRGFYGNVTSGGNIISSVNDFTGLATGMRIDSSAFTSSGTISAIDTSASTITLSGVSATSTASSVTFLAGDVITLAGVEYHAVFGSLSLDVSLSSSSNTISGISSTAGLEAGMTVTGDLIAEGTTISSIASSSSITLSANPLSSASSTTIVISDTATISSGEFGVYRGGTPAQNIGDTAKSLIRTINRYSSNTSINGFYESGFDDLPGQMLFEEEDIGGSAFQINVSAHNNAYDPVIPASGSSVASTNDQFKNAIYYSKTQEPEAVPLQNLIRIGSADADILRLVPLRDSLFIFKEDGIYRLTGEGPTSFNVDPFDLTIKLKGPETATPLNNLIYFLSDQGVSRLSETGTEPISRPIEDDITGLFSFSSIEDISFGVSYESDRKYILFLPELSSDSKPTQAYVFNTFTNAWTRWILNKQSGIIDPVSDKIHLGDADSNEVNIERKTRTFRDYVEDEIDVVIENVNSSNSTITFSSLLSLNVTSGDLIYQNDNVWGIIDSVTLSSGVAIVKNPGANWLKNFSSAITGDLTASSTSVINISSTENLVIGQSVSGTGIPDGTTISFIDTSTSLTLSNEATATNTSVAITVTATGEAKILKAIPVELEFTAQFGDNPGILKHFRDIAFMFTEVSFYDVTAGFSSELDRTTREITLSERGTGSPWGFFDWSGVPWGGGAKRGVLLRTYVPSVHQRCAQLRVSFNYKEGYSFFQLAGFNIMFNPVSERVRR